MRFVLNKYVVVKKWREKKNLEFDSGDKQDKFLYPLIKC